MASTSRTSTITQPFSGRPRTLNKRNTGTSILDRITTRNSNSNQESTLEDVIDADHDLIVFNNRQLNSLNPRNLYGTSRIIPATSLFRHQRQEALSLPDG